MNLSFRWYGESDPVTLDAIRQIPGVGGIVSALYDVAPGVAWTADAVTSLRERVEDAGLALTCIESIPVPEGVKLGTDDRDRLADAWCASVEAVGGAGVPVVCYNFMPVFDWTRTDLHRPLPDGSEALAYFEGELAEVETALASGGLPGWMDAHSPDDLRRLFAAYAEVDTERMWDHLGWFLERAVPAAEAAGVKLAIHPDDPPWPLFGLPRVVTSAAAFGRVCDLVDSPANGVTFCTGSLGADPQQAPGLAADAARLAGRGRLHFAHLRNVAHVPTPGGADGAGRDFTETPHPDGDVDLAAVVAALKSAGFDGPLRPDHGRQIWTERDNSDVRPGYGLYDRALGATYLRGLWDAATPPRS
ncbi:mannonate dehydratase [Rubrivirga litoralis]|uniref:Mannonate dehydratase n=1 Tax=Rubrivirga litoralis TaxID=3075598 RepID=A0ABU3BNM1_9BACT|nr:mannonate dehydratase [Rubrivirga sp. F394]MDT0630900.1 mannonate dehydratase [Rubrivirga sp. F394]